MTRIFDALRKAQAVRPPGAVPGPPAGLTPAPGAPALFPAARARTPVTGPGHAVLGSLPIPAIGPLRTAPDLSDEVLREMARLRINLEAAILDRVPRVVMLVSAQGGEGTTTVATQLAMVLAQDTGLRVLLADVHAQRPALSLDLAPGARRSIFGRGRDEKARLAAAAHAARLSVLPLGDATRRTGVISPQSAREMVDAVAGDFDWLVLDGPPVLESPQSAPLAAIADAVVVVAQAGRTKRPVLTRSVDLLRQAGARVLGTVLNRRRLEIPGFIYRRI